jgi:nucleoside-diphosphate-sugar epimerase
MSQSRSTRQLAWRRSKSTSPQTRASGRRSKGWRKLSGGRIASVVHLAAYYDTTGEDSPKYDAVTVQGTRRLLSALKKLGTEQFIFSSTLLVHAPSPDKGVRISENSPLDPPWAYPRSKAETEQLIASEHGDIKTVILRRRL